MKKYYSAEKNVQILISLMKQYGIRKIIASPGTTNVSFVASVQQDKYFEIYPSVDERSAAFMACGLAEESKECVALSCTGATASRNYVPGLTEAYYKKLPILVITSSHSNADIGHLFPQVTDRTHKMDDVIKFSYQLLTINSKEEEWDAIIGVNKSILELQHHGCGPVHINLATSYNCDFSVKKLPVVRKVEIITKEDEFPEIPIGEIAVVVGNHKLFSEELTKQIERFCRNYNSVVLCDQTSNYRGQHRVLANIMTNQSAVFTCKRFDLVIHIGATSGGYISFKTNEVWRVNPDGEVRDLYRKLKYVFEMEEIQFFSLIRDSKKKNDCTIIKCKNEENMIRKRIPNLPFSNLWIAKELCNKIPIGSVLHLGILNTLRSWNFFETDDSVKVCSNTGGFGIDGCVSSLIGASFINPEKLYIGIFGDLAFFYDINVLVNKKIGENVRIIVINNGIGTEFKNYNHIVSSFGRYADEFMAAGGHFGNKSNSLLKVFAINSGFKYFSASTKEGFLKVADAWLSSGDAKPALLEIFTDEREESKALELMNTIVVDKKKEFIKKIVGEKNIMLIKQLLNKYF